MPHPLKTLFWRALGLSLVLGLAMGLAVAYFPTFAQNLGEVKKLAPLPVLKAMLTEVEEGGVWAYMSGQHLFKGCNTIGCVATVLFGAFAIAGEAERRTLEIVLARPLSRRRILFVRYGLGALALALPVFLTTYLLNPAMTWAGVEGHFSVRLLTLTALHQSIFLWAVFSLAFVASTMAQRPGKIAGILLAIGMVEFSLYLVDGATYWSVFRLSDVWRFRRIESTLALDWRVVGPLLLVSALCLVVAERAFARRMPQ